MAGFMTYYLRAQMLRHILQANASGQAYSPPPIYIGLFLSVVTEDGTGTEVAGNAYQRQRVLFTVPADGQSPASNSSVVTFPRPTGVWGTLTYFGLFDAASGGNMLYAAPLSAPILMDATSSPLNFDVGSITVGEVAS